MSKRGSRRSDLRPAGGGRALAAQRQLRHRRPPRSRCAHADRPRNDPLAQHQRAARRPNCSSTSTGTPGAISIRPGCANGGSPPQLHAAARDDAWGSIDVTSGPRHAAGGDATSDLTSQDALPRARRRQRRRSHGDGRAAAGSRWSRTETVEVEVEWTAQDPRPFARTGYDRRLLLHRPVVSRRWASSRTRAGTHTSSTPPPSSTPTTASTTCAYRARADSSSARPAARDGSATDNARRHRPRTGITARTSTTSPGRRVRDSSSRTRTFEHPTLPPVRCGCCCSPSTPARQARHFDATAAALQLLRRVVRALSVRPHHDRRPRVSERQRRHGVPDVVHRPARVGSRRRASRRPKA